MLIYVISLIFGYFFTVASLVYWIEAIINIHYKTNYHFASSFLYGYLDFLSGTPLVFTLNSLLPFIGLAIGYFGLKNIKSENLKKYYKILLIIAGFSALLVFYLFIKFPQSISFLISTPFYFFH